jgi:hypothetical protein
MKMVKSLLLGSAAGIVAISGAQAADLPVKAKAVEYVKVCSIYGSGFYYIPGTDTCLKVGGYVRMDVGFNAGGSHGPYVNGAAGRNNDEDTPWYQTRVRGIFSFDTRTQTEYGTLRSYMRGGWEQNSGDANYRGIQYLDRAFIQFAGFTFGKTQSFFGFYSNALNYSTLQGGGQSDAGLNLIAYTAQFAGGFSASISLEDASHHRGSIWDATTSSLSIASYAGNASGGLPGYGNYVTNRWPDVIAALRVDQPWGSAQISAAVHDASGSYYGAHSTGGSAGLDDVGFAVQGGVKFNLPWAQGDEFWVQGVYAKGAVNYLGFNQFVHSGPPFAMYARGAGTCGTASLQTGSCGSIGIGHALDGVFSTASGALDLTEGWAVLAAVQHYWTPNLRTSVFGQYTQLDYGAAATATYCAGNVGGTTAGNVTAMPGGCNPDFAMWQVGTRTIWTPVRNLDIGVEVLYTKLDQNMSGVWGLANNGARAGGGYAATDRDTFSGLLRFQRGFWP